MFSDSPITFNRQKKSLAPRITLCVMRSIDTMEVEELLGNLYFMIQFNIGFYQGNKLELMGCYGSQVSKETVPINKSVIHLLQSGNTDLLLKKLKSDHRSFDLNSQCNFKGDTLLHYAASRDNVELTKYLISQNADPNIKNLENKKPLNIANNQQIINILSKLTKPDTLNPEDIRTSPIQSIMIQDPAINPKNANEPLQPIYQQRQTYEQNNQGYRLTSSRVLDQDEQQENEKQHRQRMQRSKLRRNGMKAMEYLDDHNKEYEYEEI